MVLVQGNNSLADLHIHHTGCFPVAGLHTDCIDGHCTGQT
jgi:hypothetical protein